MQEIRPDAIEMVGGSIYRNGSLVPMENGLKKQGKRRVGKNCFKATNAKCNECHLEPKWFRGK